MNLPVRSRRSRAEGWEGFLLATIAHLDEYLSRAKINLTEMFLVFVGHETIVNSFG
jgi:hypothetical protein